jgi:hypothetical protein
MHVLMDIPCVSASVWYGNEYRNLTARFIRLLGLSDGCSNILYVLHGLIYIPYVSASHLVWNLFVILPLDLYVSFGCDGYNDRLKSCMSYWPTHGFLHLYGMEMGGWISASVWYRNEYCTLTIRFICALGTGCIL